MKSGETQTTCLEKLKKIPKNEFSIHGLWPGLKSGQLLKDCGNVTTEKEIEVIANSTEKDFFNDYMNKYWVSFKNNDYNFWVHEYNKHGLCYTNKKKQKDFTQYFKDTMDFFIKNGFSRILKDTFPYVTDPSRREIGIGKSIIITVTKQDMDIILKSIFPGAFYKLSCEIKNKETGYLTEIYFYYDEDFKPYNVPFPADSKCGGELDDIKLVFKE